MILVCTVRNALTDSAGVAYVVDLSSTRCCEDRVDSLGINKESHQG